MHHRNPIQQALSVALVVSLLGSQPFPAWGWSQEAHRAIALIAMDQLKGTNTAKRVQTLLGKLTLDQIATCPDEVRELEAHEIKKLDASCAKVFPKPIPTGTEQWHFVNTQIKDASFTPTADDVNTVCAGQCAVVQIPKFLAVLAAATPTDSRTQKLKELQALSFVTHFIGDIHQPLHAAERGDDAGGNAEIVTFFGDKEKLHGIWDNQIVTRIDKTETDLASDLEATEVVTAAGEAATDDTAWAIQSYEYARDVAYKGVDPANGSEPVATLDADYQNAAAPVVRIQIARAGVRLAAALREALP